MTQMLILFFSFISFIINIALVFHFVCLQSEAKIYANPAIQVSKNKGNLNIYTELIKNGVYGSENLFWPCSELEYAYDKFLIYEIIIGEYTDYLIPRFQHDKTDYIFGTCEILAFDGIDDKVDDNFMPYTYTPINPFDSEKFDGFSYLVPLKLWFEPLHFRWEYLGGNKLGTMTDFLHKRPYLNIWGTSKQNNMYQGGCCRQFLNSTEKFSVSLPYVINAYIINSSYVYFRSNAARTFINTSNNQTLKIDASVTDIYMRADYKFTNVTCQWTVIITFALDINDKKKLDPIIILYNNTCLLNFIVNVSSKYVPTVNVSCAISSYNKVFWPPDKKAFYRDSIIVVPFVTTTITTSTSSSTSSNETIISTSLTTTSSLTASKETIISTSLNTTSIAIKKVYKVENKIFLYIIAIGIPVVLLFFIIISIIILRRYLAKKIRDNSFVE